jgi:hypothetical protein
MVNFLLTILPVDSEFQMLGYWITWEFTVGWCLNEIIGSELFPITYFLVCLCTASLASFHTMYHILVSYFK